jgi:hypothetical protein
MEAEVLENQRERGESSTKPVRRQIEEPGKAPVNDAEDQAERESDKTCSCQLETASE